jgi:arylsulfatase A-like enzyme
VRRAAALALVLAACGGKPVTAPRHVVLVVLDACHGDALGCQGGDPRLTPALDAVAAAGVRFDRACADASWTLPATTSLLTGWIPEHHGVLTSRQRAPDALTLLPEMFAAAGWRTAGFVQMVYASDAYGLKQGFDDYRYYGADEKRDERLAADALAWLDAHAGERSFLYVHARRPHGPYNPEEPALKRAGVTALPGAERLDLLMHADSKLAGPADLQPGESELLAQLYRANLSTIDEHLAPLLARALADPATLLVVTADHGEALGEHGAFGHGGQVWAETLDIPLLVAGAGLPPHVDHDAAFTVDVLPTLLQLCGLQAAQDARLDGRSLADRLRGRPAAPGAPVVVAARIASEQDRPDRAVVDGDWKLLLHADGRVQLFDRRADRRDAHDLAAERPAEVARLRPLAEAWRPPPLGGAAPELDAAREQDLHALGYVK